MTRSQGTSRDMPSPAIDERRDDERPSNLGDLGQPASQPTRELDDALDEGLEETFPGSDPVSATRRTRR